MKNLFGLLFLSLSIFAQAQKAPDFTMTDIHNNQWSLYDELAKGKTVVLDFFFANCTPCQTLTPMMEQVYQDYGAGAANVMVFGISFTDNNARLLQFEQNYGATYPSAGNEGGGDTITSLYQSWFPFVGFPTYAVVCPDSSVFWNLPRNANFPELRDSLDVCLAKFSLPDLKKSVTLQLYPNPARDVVHFENSWKGNVDLKIMSLQGSLLRNWAVEKEDYRLDVWLPHLRAGTYIFEIKLGEQKAQHLLVIK